MAYWGSRYESQWAPYVPVAERRRKAEQEMQKLARKGHPVAPVKLEGKKIATTFWGKAWCDNLESYRDYENRLPRGRTYVRNGSVVDLQIAPLEVSAYVAGSSVYRVKVTIGEVARKLWSSICRDCAGGIDSLVELLQGRFSQGVMERICRQGEGLFPKPSDIKFTCSCPDSASLCKHIAAVMYGVGARLDAQPELLFRLRAVNEKDLIAEIGDALPMTKTAPRAGKVLEADDMAAMFGLDMEADEPVPVPKAKASKARTKAPDVPGPKTKRAAATAPAAAPKTRKAAPAPVTPKPRKGAPEGAAPKTRTAASVAKAVASPPDMVTPPTKSRPVAGTSQATKPSARVTRPSPRQTAASRGIERDISGGQTKAAKPAVSRPGKRKLASS